MTYIPIKSLEKSLGSVRIEHTGGGNASQTLDTGSSTPVTFTLGTWTEIYASSTKPVKAIEIFDSTGEIAIIATGASSSEVVQFRIIPGGNGLNYFKIDEASRITLRYESALPTAGSETVINFYR